MLTNKQSAILDRVFFGLVVAGGILIGCSLNGRGKTLQNELENEQRKNTILASTCRGMINMLLEAQTDVQTVTKLKTLGLSNAKIAEYINKPENYVQALLLAKEGVSI